MSGIAPGIDPLSLSDPRAMRALAHPTRIALLDYLYWHGQSTATQCAEAIGDSTGSCSYHLRCLAKWGFIEEMPGKGRERPWRRTTDRVRWSTTRGQSPDYQAASALLRQHYLERDERLFAAYLANEDTMDIDWREAVDFSNSALYISATELLDLCSRYHALIEQYSNRPPDQRPHNARRVNVLFRTIPHTD